MYGPYHAYGGGNTSAYERGFLDASTRNLYWVDNIVDLGSGVGPSGASSLYTATINILTHDLVLTQIVAGGVDAPLSGDIGGGPNAWLLPDGGGGFYLGGASGSGGFRWYAINADGKLTGFVGSMGPISCGAGPALTPPRDAQLVSGMVLHVDAGGAVWTIGGTGPCVDYPVVPGSGIDCEGIPGSDCVASSGLQATQIGTLGIGTNAAASITVVSETEAWVLAINLDTLTISKVDPTSGIVVEYTLGSGSGTNLTHLEYCAIDNTLLYWAGHDDTLYKWDIVSHSVVNSASVPYLGSGPIVTGKIPNGIDLYSAVSLELALTANGNNPSLPDYFDATLFGHLYNGGTVIWLQANDNNVYGAVLAPSTGIPHGANCNNYENGGALSPNNPPGCGLLLGEMV